VRNAWRSEGIRFPLLNLESRMPAQSGAQIPAISGQALRRLGSVPRLRTELSRRFATGRQMTDDRQQPHPPERPKVEPWRLDGLRARISLSLFSLTTEGRPLISPWRLLPFAPFAVQIPLLRLHSRLSRAGLVNSLPVRWLWLAKDDE